MKKLSLEYLKNMLDMRTKLLNVLRKDLEDACDQLDKREKQLAMTEFERDNLRKRVKELNEDKQFMRHQINDLIDSKQTLRIDIANLQKALAEARRQAEWWRQQDADEDYIASLEVQADEMFIPIENDSQNAPRGAHKEKS